MTTSVLPIVSTMTVMVLTGYLPCLSTTLSFTLGIKSRTPLSLTLICIFLQFRHSVFTNFLSTMIVFNRRSIFSHSVLCSHDGKQPSTLDSLTYKCGLTFYTPYDMNLGNVDHARPSNVRQIKMPQRN